MNYTSYSDYHWYFNRPNAIVGGWFANKEPEWGLKDGISGMFTNHSLMPVDPGARGYVSSRNYTTVFYSTDYHEIHSKPEYNEIVVGSPAINSTTIWKDSGRGGGFCNLDRRGRAIEIDGSRTLTSGLSAT